MNFNFRVGIEKTLSFKNVNKFTLKTYIYGLFYSEIEVSIQKKKKKSQLVYLKCIYYTSKIMYLLRQSKRSYEKILIYNIRNINN